MKLFKLMAIVAPIIFAMNSTTFAHIKQALNPKDYFANVTNPKHSNTDPIWGNIKRPFPTSAWYINLTLKTNDDNAVGLRPIFPFPYTVASTTNGISVSLPRTRFAKDNNNKVFAQLYPYNPQFTISAATSGSDITRKILSANELYADLAFVKDAEHSMHAPITRGSPYITMFYQAMTPVLTPHLGLLSVNGQPPGSALQKCSRFEIVLGVNETDKQTWIVYTETPVTLQWQHTDTGWQLQASDAYTGWLRLALLNDTQVKIHNKTTVLDDNAAHIPLSGKIEYQYQNKTANTIFKWTTQDNLAPLLMTLPHQQTRLKTKLLPVSDISMRNTSGEMRGIIAKQWEMQRELPDISLLEMKDINILGSTQKNALIETIQQDAENINATLDPANYGVYTSGKRFARAARLSLLANQFQLHETEKRIINAIERNMETWIQGENKWQLQYDLTWGGIIPKIDDFGSQDYNDHHFHYGYFTYTFAVLATLDPQWVNTGIKVNNKQITPLQWVTFLIRDFANPDSADSYFPYSRHSDAFNGHSWASGIGMAWQDGRNQESISEAANAYHAIAALGKVIKDDDMMKWGQLLLSREIDGANTYWYIDKDSDIYAKAYRDEYSIVTNMWEGKIDAHSWFGDNLEYSYGIEMMPFTANTSLLIKKPWLSQNYSRLLSIYQNLPNTNVGWKWIMFKGAYLASPADKFNEFWNEALASSLYDEGDSKANTLYVLAAKEVAQ